MFINQTRWQKSKLERFTNNGVADLARAELYETFWKRRRCWTIDHEVIKD